VISLIFTTIQNNAVQLFILAIMWSLFLGVFINGWILSRRVRKILAEKYGANKVERGITGYVAMRSIQMRPMRLPKPQVKRGAEVG